MKKIISNMLIGFFLIILIMTAALMITNYTQGKIESNSNDRFSIENPPDYRVMVIVDGTDKSYADALKLGMDKSALYHNIAYEYWQFSGDRKNEDILEQFDIAIRSNVDGIVIQALEDEEFNSILDKANEKAIPVVTIETNIPQAERVSFISFNRYQIGTQIGVKLKNRLQSLGHYSGLVIMFDGIDVSIKDQAVALNEEINMYYQVKVEPLEYEGENILNAEGVTKDLLSEYPDIVSIICNNSEEALGVIQALKDANKLDDVQVIAFGDDPDILDYVKRKVIYATVVPDIEGMGYNVIKNLIDYKNGNFVSSYQNIDVDILSKENIVEYLEGKDHEN